MIVEACAIVCTICYVSSSIATHLSQRAHDRSMAEVVSALRLVLVRYITTQREDPDTVPFALHFPEPTGPSAQNNNDSDEDE